MSKKLVKWVIIALIGVWITFDGIISILLYLYQSLLEHLLRLVRSAAGIILIYFAYTKWTEYKDKGRG